MATTFGSDFSAVEDFDANWTFLEGDAGEALALTQALARRLSTPRGGLFYDPAYGLDIRGFIADSVSPADAAAQIENECRKDERVDDAKCTITASGEGASTVWTVDIRCAATTGKVYNMTLEVSRLSVTLLKGG
jgi:phage baseplate assembly protein W